jgi:hypothetical protein
LSERPEAEESSQGYPEEAPPGADPAQGEGPGPREGADVPRKHDDQDDDGDDDGKATGNPRSAG